MLRTPTTYLPPAMSTSKSDARRLQQLLESRHAQWLTHGPMALITVAYFAALLTLPFWLAFLPCVVLAHRIGTLLHEYIHGIPFKRYVHNHAVVTLYDGLMLMFGTFEMFRVSHLEHHRWLNSHEDGARATAGKVGKSRLLDFIAGLSLIQYLIGFWHALLGRKRGVNRGRILSAAIISLLCIAAWVAVGRADVVWKMLLVTAFTMAVPVSLRSAIEHHSFPGDSAFANEYRVWIPLFNLNRHIHHHEDPSVPWYRLRWRTSHPLPRWHYVAHWFRVYVKRQFVLMRPMRSSDVRREVTARR